MTRREFQDRQNLERATQRRILQATPVEQVHASQKARSIGASQAGEPALRSTGEAPAEAMHGVPIEAQGGFADGP